MAEIKLDVGARLHRDIARLARLEGARFGLSTPLGVDEMALALLEAHLVLVRDCGDILPAASGSLKTHAHNQRKPGVISGANGVSLGDGINVSSKP